MNQDYLTVFLEESQEHLQALNENVLKLEKNPAELILVGEIFRSAHTFKGMSATMGFDNMADLTHEMENLLDDIRNGKSSINEAKIDVILECIENLEKMVSNIQSGGKGEMEVSQTIIKLRSFKTENDDGVTADKEEAAVPSFSQKGSHIVKVTLRDDCMLKGVRSVMVLEALNEVGKTLETSPSQEKLEEGDFGTSFSVLMNSKESEGEIISAVLSVSEIESAALSDVLVGEDNNEATPVPGGQTKATGSSKSHSNGKVENKTIRVNLEKIEDLMNMFEETVIERGRIEELVYKLEHPELHERIQRLDIISKELQNLVLNMRMVPVETVFNRFPRMVRQLSKDLNKQIELVISGQETEIDRIVIDEIGDPLVHLIRNSVDHGVETPEERVANGKPEQGTVNLNAFHSGNNIVIEITDDGKGLNRQRVLEKAISKGILSNAEGAKLSANEVAELIFEPGFSTAETISEVSGRGVGLDVVKTTITKLGGNVTVKTEEGSGSTFRIELPLTLSIIQSMIVGVGESRYAIPLGNIVETMKIPTSVLQNIQGNDVMNYREKTIPIVRLDRLFNEPDSELKEPSHHQVVIVKTLESVYAMAVDSIFGQREIVLKSLGDFFKEGADFFSGGTVLGDGRVVLILDCEKTKYKK